MEIFYDPLAQASNPVFQTSLTPTVLTGLALLLIGVGIARLLAIRDNKTTTGTAERKHSDEQR